MHCHAWILYSVYIPDLSMHGNGELPPRAVVMVHYIIIATILCVLIDSEFNRAIASVLCNYVTIHHAMYTVESPITDPPTIEDNLSLKDTSYGTD